MDRIHEVKFKSECFADGCSNMQTHQETVEVNGVDITVKLCDEHTETWKKDEKRREKL